MSFIPADLRFMNSLPVTENFTVFIKGILFCPVITNRQESSDNPGRFRVTVPDALEKPASQSVSA